MIMLKSMKAKSEIYEWTYHAYGKFFIKGYCTPNQKLACFVPYLKIVNTFMKNNNYALHRISSKNSKVALQFK